MKILGYDTPVCIIRTSLTRKTWGTIRGKKQQISDFSPKVPMLSWTPNSVPV